MKKWSLLVFCLALLFSSRAGATGYCCAVQPVVVSQAFVQPFVQPVVAFQAFAVQPVVQTYAVQPIVQAFATVPVFQSFHARAFAVQRVVRQRVVVQRQVVVVRQVNVRQAVRVRPIIRH